MCGIAGIVNLPQEQSRPLIEQMTYDLRHRGPDAGAVFVEDGIALGHRRLSIIDLSTGANQPFWDYTRRYVIVFNGEIYNYQEVRAKLNYSWQTTSDTEVILASYLTWGVECLQHLNGMFALAIWDTLDKRLFLARDRLGVKPLYYAYSKKSFIFCSEIRAILNTGLVERNLNTSHLADYLSAMAIKTPHTIIEGIQQLLPGEYALFEEKTLHREQYWDLIDAAKRVLEPNPIAYEGLTHHVRHLFEQAVQSRMVADVPVGAFLSGGVDSSAIVALMSQYSTAPINTFSIVFSDKKFDESVYAQQIATQYQTNHHELLLEPTEVLTMLEEYFEKMDSPTVDGLNTYIVSKLVAKTGIRVAMSGLGGDELFAGYVGFKRFQQSQQYFQLLRLPFCRQVIRCLHCMFPIRSINKLYDFATTKQWDLVNFYRTSRSIYLQKESTAILNDHQNLSPSSWSKLDSVSLKDYDSLSQYSIAELCNYTLDVLLKDTDQMSMAWGLEVREPFFDYYLVDFVLRIPDHYKQKGDYPKSLFIDAIKDLLPPTIIHRPKKGFSFPWDKWIREDIKSYCEQAIFNLAKRPFFKEKAIKTLWGNFLQKKQGIIWVHVWALVVLEKWLVKNKF
ncbi:MAG: asparagine synthase (glutamine-hydrolyzing) [Spirosomataceae bacterium]